MPQYVVKLVHSPDQCPTSNSKVRDRMVKGAPQIPQLAGKMGIRFIAGPLVLASEHEALAVVEASNVEAVNEFILQSGLMQWSTVKVSATKSMEDAMKDLEKSPPPIY